MSAMASTTACEVTLSSSDHLAGDLLRATVTVRGKNETVDWAAVQVHGHCWHDPRLVASVAPPTSQQQQPTPKQLKAKRSSSTSNASNVDKKTAMPDMSSWIEGSTCLFATKPLCIAAELPLDGEHNFIFQATLPPVLPPSFRGVSTRYGYLLTVCVKIRSEESARVAHIPFYVAGTPGSLGDAARIGVPSSAFLESASGGNGLGRRRQSRLRVDSDEDEELVMIQSEMQEEGTTTDPEFINKFPFRYSTWDPTAISSRPQELDEKVWFLERDEAEEETLDVAPLPSPKLSDAHHSHAADLATETVSTRALNAQIAKGRLARCFILPSLVNPGDPLNVRLDFTGAAEKCLKVHARIEVEERTMGPPPLVAVFEPLLTKRQGSGPWIKQLASKSIDVSMCSSCAFSLSTYGAPPDFSTDLIVVHTYLRIEFTTPSMNCSLRVPLNVRPPARATRLVSLTPELERLSFPKTPSVPPAPQVAQRFGEQSPPPTPQKRLVF